MSSVARRAMGCALSLLLSSTPATAQSPADTPVADFFQPVAMPPPVLSPDGRRLALVVRTPDGRSALGVADAASPGRVVGVAQYPNADIDRVVWVNDRRLLFGARSAEAGKEGAYSFVAIDADGADPQDVRLASANFRLLRDGSDDIITFLPSVRGSIRDIHAWTPRRIDTRHWKGRDAVPDAPRYAADWVFDAQGVPVAVRAVEWDGETAVLWRDPATRKWQEIDRYMPRDLDRILIAPLGALPDGRLLVRARRGDAARTAALFAYDPRQRQLDDAPMVALAGFDLTGDPITDPRSGVLYGVTYVSDAPGIAWLHPDMAALQKRIDDLLPDTNNRFICEACAGQRWFVVTAGTDRHPDVYYLFDREGQGAAALEFLGPSRTVPERTRLASRSLHRVPARDGASIPVYLTRPAGKGPWPAVVLVHGGPWVRGSMLGFDAEAQFLASRGYLVVEPEFRGSLGYGDTWFRAGFGQWGLAMQDDVTDATRWVVAQGLADERRLAIAGASFGGYAALMGVVREPGLYRAAVAWAAVTDIDLLFEFPWHDHTAWLWQREGMPVLVGDRSRQGEQFRRTSPLHRAADIRQPVLLAHGGADARVPIEHGERLRDALRVAGNAPVEWVPYPGEGHTFSRANRIDLWRRVEAFLGERLK